ncbi:hypothetical protein G9A89_006395 [Geosiphon pyriformis]|nr:hypothetical protein G9A89_006395 [Geosiphon pyriformis]
MGACCGDNEEYSTATKFYCQMCILKCFEQPKRVEKWDNTPCLACGETLLDEGIGTCNKTCQYMILINDWVCKRTPINDAWKQALRQLEGYPHNKHELWRMANAKAEGATINKLLEIKNNSLLLPEPEYVQIFDVFGNIEDDPEKFHKHY